MSHWAFVDSIIYAPSFQTWMTVGSSKIAAFHPDVNVLVPRSNERALCCGDKLQKFSPTGTGAFQNFRVELKCASSARFIFLCRSTTLRDEGKWGSIRHQTALLPVKCSIGAVPVAVLITKKRLDEFVHRNDTKQWFYSFDVQQTIRINSPNQIGNVKLEVWTLR